MRAGASSASTRRHAELWQCTWWKLGSLFQVFRNAVGGYLRQNSWERWVVSACWAKCMHVVHARAWNANAGGNEVDLLWPNRTGVASLIKLLTFLSRTLHIASPVVKCVVTLCPAWRAQSTPRAINAGQWKMLVSPKHGTQSRHQNGRVSHPWVRVNMQVFIYIHCCLTFYSKYEGGGEQRLIPFAAWVRFILFFPAFTFLSRTLHIASRAVKCVVKLCQRSSQPFLNVQFCPVSAPMLSVSLGCPCRRASQLFYW